MYRIDMERLLFFIEIIIWDRTIKMGFILEILSSGLQSTFNTLYLVAKSQNMFQAKYVKMHREKMNNT